MGGDFILFYLRILYLQKFQTLKNLSSIHALLDIVIFVSSLLVFSLYTYGSFRKRVRQWGRRHYGNISLHRVFLPLANRFSVAPSLRWRYGFSNGCSKLRRSPLMNIHLWRPNQSSFPSSPPIPFVCGNAKRATSTLTPTFTKDYNNDDHYSCHFSMVCYIQMSSKSLSVFPTADSTMTNVYNRT